VLWSLPKQCCSLVVIVDAGSGLDGHSRRSVAVIIAPWWPTGVEAVADVRPPTFYVGALSAVTRRLRVSAAPRALQGIASDCRERLPRCYRVAGNTNRATTPAWSEGHRPETVMSAISAPTIVSRAALTSRL